MVFLKLQQQCGINRLHVSDKPEIRVPVFDVDIFSMLSAQALAVKGLVNINPPSFCRSARPSLASVSIE